MKFTTPWSPDLDAWQRFVPAAVAPGLDTACTGPSPGRPPIIHRFHHLILLPCGPFDLPMAPSVDYNLIFASLDNACTRTKPPPPTQIHGGPYVPGWASRLRWGVCIVYEQAWHWMGSSLGELIDSISLTPHEELEIQVFTWDRTKLSSDLETTDLVDQKSETSLTMHASSQVLRRLEKETHWNFGANVGYSAGVTAGVELGVGQSSSDLMERRLEQTQDLTNHIARQIRSERRVAISTVRESGIEERRTRKLTNPNPSQTLTFNFYETISHYRVEIAPVETHWVVALPNSLPEITPAWIVCHEGILRQHLLDPHQSRGFESAQRLAQRFPPDLIREAVTRLHQAFTHQPMAVSYPILPGRELPVPRPICEEEEPVSNLERLARVLAAVLSGGASEVVRGVIELAGEETAGAEGYRYTYHFIENFLGGVIRSPSVAGLLAAMKLVTDWFKPFVTEGGQCCYPVSQETEAALGYAYSVLVQATGEYWQEPSLSLSEEASEESQKAAREAWLEWKREQKEAIDQMVIDQMAFEGLRCHIEENILHYMRPIWLAEDPGQHLFRLTADLLGGTGEEPLVARLIDLPLLGFHLNCSVFPVRLGSQLENALREALKSSSGPSRLPDPEGPKTFAALVSDNAKKLKGQVRNYFINIAQQRFQEDGKRLLNRAMREAVRDALLCKSPPTVDDGTPGLTPDMLPEVMSTASARLQEALKAVQEKTSLYLSHHENRLRTQVEDHFDRLAKIHVDQKNTIESLGHMLAAAKLADRLTTAGDLKPIMVSLPDGGYYCEPVLGRCLAVDPLRQRTLEAETTSREALARQEHLEANRRAARLETGQLEPEPSPPTVIVKLEQSDTD